MRFNLNKDVDCYLLGYFWADCFFGLNKKTNAYNFSFEIKTTDFLMLWELLNNLGFDSYTTRCRKNSNNSQSCIRNAKQENMRFMLENNFHLKSDGCPIYFKMTEDMKKFFIKGFLDGDGSISVDKNLLFRVGFNGNKEQSWDFLEDYCNSHDIDYVIYRKDRISQHTSHKKQTHGYSVFEFTKLQDRVNFCKTIEHIDIGIHRKLDIYKKYKNMRLDKQYKNMKYKQLVF